MHPTSLSLLSDAPVVGDFRHSTHSSILCRLLSAMSPPRLALTTTAAFFLSSLSPILSRTFVFTSYFNATDSSCTGAPQYVHIEDIDGCNFQSCQLVTIGATTNYSTINCYSDDQQQTADNYAKVDAPYVLVEQFSPEYEVCGLLTDAVSFYADGVCWELPENASYAAAIATVGADLSVELSLYNDSVCGGTDFYYFSVPSYNVTTSQCYEGYSRSFKFYANTPEAASWSYAGSGPSASSSGMSSLSSSSEASRSSNTLVPVSPDDSSLSGGAIAGIIAGCVAAVLCIAAVVYRRKKRTKQVDKRLNSAELNDKEEQLLAEQDSQGKTTSSQHTPGAVGGDGSSLWTDEVIVAARIPREKVIIQQIISRGGYGEVHAGTFNGEHVAIKMLLPETRKRIRNVNEFLCEVKLMATLEHPHIVTFIGVAWDSLTDLCVVTQFMDGGDLRALLNQYQVENRPVGFGYHKTKIALHVAHALTYMHSLAPPLVHRDLKSKNILLTSNLDAKLTDFGASRERIDRTMTAGVGTSLWMAPEMMIGERYDEKADVFSFGVVLSELDSHGLPYANIGQDRRRSDVALLQLVMLGKVHVEFSKLCSPSIVELGMACVAKDPVARPSAAEALYKLQVILAQEMRSEQAFL